MGKPQTTEERVVSLEQASFDCANMQKERFDGLMKRVERLENKLIGALGLGVVVLVGVAVNILLTLVKK